MACFKPLKAYLFQGRLIFSPVGGVTKHYLIPCGQCIGCRRERSRQWAMRCVHEAKMHEFNCFITLTYAPEHLPENGNLHYPHFQLFMKRLRKRFSGIPIRFYMCGEYGDNFNRPHYHACLFGIDFADKKPHSRTASALIYTSEVLQSLWPFGFSSLGELNFNSAAYVARYVMKKITGKDADAHYTAVSCESGEIFKRVPEFTKMSLKPGIGASWYEKYKSDVFPHNRVIVNNKPVKPPRFYMRRLRKENFTLFEQIQRKNVLDARKVVVDNKPSRRQVKSFLALEAMKRLPRNSF